MLRWAWLPLFLLSLPSVSLTAQTIVWSASDNGGRAITRADLFCSEGATCSPSAGTTLGPIKIDSGVPTFVTVVVSPGVGPAGNWLRYAPVVPGAQCATAPYNTYPAAFSAVTPIYLCLGASLATTPNQSRGYYAASITFTPNSGTAFALPIQLTVSPSGYLQLDSPTVAGAYNDYVFNVGVLNGVADSALTVYATLKDSNGTVLQPQVSATPFDDWVIVSSLANPNSTTQAFQIAVNPAQLPSGQATAYSRVRFNNQGNQQGESSIFVNANVTLPPPTLSLGVTSISFSYPNGSVSQTLNPQSSGATIAFTAAATSDDGTGWLSVNPTTGDTQTPLTVSANVTPSRAPGTYTGRVVATPTSVSGSPITVPVTLQVSSTVYRVAGTISDAKGACSSGVTVRLSGGNTTNTVTASDGSYSFSGLLPGQYVITPSKSGCTFNPASLTVNLSADSLNNNFAGSQTPLTLLYPLNGATGISPNSTLTWSAVSGATSYDVYFGVGNPPLVANVAGTSWPITGASANLTYTWRIVARGASGTLASSDSWSFSTVPPMPASGLYFIPVTPCHLVDTRQNQSPTGAFGPPTMSGGETRTFFPAFGACVGISPSAKAYSFTVTARPITTMPYLTIFPTGQPRPDVSTLNAFAGGTVSNSAIVPAGDGGGVNVYVTDPADIALDINGYFDSIASGAATAFYTLPPCRIADTGQPMDGTFRGLGAGSSRDFPIANSACVPAQAKAVAYSLNVTVRPAGPLDYVEVWPSGSPQPPGVITLGSPSGAYAADAAIVQGSTSGSVTVYASNATDIVLDTNGYFGAPGGAGALLFHSVPPCRVANTRDPTIRPLGGPGMGADETRTFPVGGSCGIPLGVQAYSLNVTVVPPAALSFVTLWPTGLDRPGVSTLNDLLGITLANAAIVPVGTNDSINVYVNQATHVILDINGYFSAQ